MSPFDINDPATYPPVGAWMWHVHHEELTEPLTEPLANRIAYIRTEKPADEIETRLRVLTPVLGATPAAYVKARDALDKAGDALDKARAAYVKAGDAYDKAGDAYDKARDALDKARAAYVKAGDAYDKARDAYDKAGDAYDKARDALDRRPALEALHAVEHPGCPWNGRTIFP